MIYRNQKETQAIYRNNKAIVSVYRGLRLVWELIKSCFGRGYWINNAPYANADGWRNNQ